ncbi:hypothetical protein UFOVP1020_23 [uncultured Caudovirales phage]|uniref:Uncharacterized protein n=1 Tax=uncultured Caudovirales phage TaxID=2100421 RepID=A0A6J5MMB2_9CAUD|nr:hypothetical protein UFOVP512_28 [uncultured Caudovirales phage]CAB4178682.1 hypothetical protein UFOVP1020_23 [uncultured Caudovirales phage]CAB4187939.1 hypothetical protein UFOVP1170_18 [uncultured Caudovirales phage]CAB4220408.1 hypothetical protein UFOVP1621_27 [uncultured Caudovirales phage]
MQPDIEYVKNLIGGLHLEIAQLRGALTHTERERDEWKAKAATPAEPAQDTGPSVA